MVPGCKGSGVQQHYRFYFAFYPFLRQVGEKVEQNLIVDHGCGNAAVAGHKSVPGLYPVIQIQDRKSTRLNSSHVAISYAVFCLKKKKININIQLSHNQDTT